METLNHYCPSCNSEDTYEEYSDLQGAVECRTCEDCGVSYMLHYEMAITAKYIGNRVDYSELLKFKQN